MLGHLDKVNSKCGVGGMKANWQSKMETSITTIGSDYFLLSVSVMLHDTTHDEKTSCLD